MREEYPFGDIGSDCFLNGEREDCLSLLSRESVIGQGIIGRTDGCQKLS